MRILDDTSTRGDGGAFAVEMQLGDEAGDAELRERWQSAADKGEYGGPHALGAVRELQDRTVGVARGPGALQRAARRRRLEMDRGGAGHAPAGRSVRDHAGRLPHPAAAGQALGKSRREVKRTAPASRPVGRRKGMVSAAEGATTGAAAPRTRRDRISGGGSATHCR